MMRRAVGTGGERGHDQRVNAPRVTRGIEAGTQRTTAGRVETVAAEPPPLRRKPTGHGNAGTPAHAWPVPLRVCAWQTTPKAHGTVGGVLGTPPLSDVRFFGVTGGNAPPPLTASLEGGGGRGVRSDGHPPRAGRETPAK